MDTRRAETACWLCAQHDSSPEGDALAIKSCLTQNHSRHKKNKQIKRKMSRNKKPKIRQMLKIKKISGRDKD
mgnify:CR=1 FL=1